MKNSSVIKTNDLTKRYGKARGIENVNLDIRAGEMFGFIGPNGAGKSTTIRTLLGLIQPTAGSAEIFGKDITEYGPEIRQEIGYLPSEVFYYDGMKAIDLLNYSASFYNKPKDQMKRRIHELADLLDLDVKKKIDDLSYGNKKKVGIIQGLLHSPKLVILDEPTGGLDPLMQQTFFDILKRENEKGVTVLFSSHILSEVQRLCDRVAIIKEGKLIAVEKMNELRAKQYKRCKLIPEETIDIKKFSIEGVSNLAQNGDDIEFLYRGDVNTLVKLLAKYPLRNAWIEEPDLEEVFLHYYQKDV